MVAPFQPDPTKVAGIRAALLATGAGIYLDTATAGPLAAEGLHAMREWLAQEERFGQADPVADEAFAERADEARAVLATLIDAHPEAVALSSGATAGMAAAAWAPDWRRGERIVTTTAEHPAVLAELQAVQARFDTELVQVALGTSPGAFEAAGLVERFAAAITPATRLVAVSHVTWQTGVIMPLGAIAAQARRVGAWLAIDGAQAVGAIPVAVTEAAPDVYAFSGYKWLLGPRGVGATYRSPRLVAEGAPMSAALGGTRATAGTLHRPSVVALARTVGWLEMYVGLTWAFERSCRLAAQAWSGLAAVPGVVLLTPGPPPATLIAFRIDGWPAELARAALARRVFALTRVVTELDALRISVAWFNTVAELDRFVGAVAELAAATPETLPDRPRLVVLPADG
jgi:selenocysteine lyase/cysteine desulfurase